VGASKKCSRTDRNSTKPRAATGLTQQSDLGNLLRFPVAFQQKGSVFLLLAAIGSAAVGPVAAAPLTSAKVLRIVDGNQVFIDANQARINQTAGQGSLLSTRQSRAELLFNTPAIGLLGRTSVIRLGARCFRLDSGVVVVNGSQRACLGSRIVVHSEGGTVDKFIGDATLAVFGVPYSRGDHQEASSALRAAVEIHRRLERLNQRWSQEGKEPWEQVVILNFGTVISGNIGSSHRMDYTVIGEAVNATSRLEYVAKQCGRNLILSHAFVEQLHDRDRLEHLGDFELRGHGLESVYGLLPPAETSSASRPPAATEAAQHPARA